MSALSTLYDLSKNGTVRLTIRMNAEQNGIHISYYPEKTSTDGPQIVMRSEEQLSIEQFEKLFIV